MWPHDYSARWKDLLRSCWRAEYAAEQRLLRFIFCTSKQLLQWLLVCVEASFVDSMQIVVKLLLRSDGSTTWRCLLATRTVVCVNRLQNFLAGGGVQADVLAATLSVAVALRTLVRASSAYSRPRTWQITKNTKLFFFKQYSAIFHHWESEPQHVRSSVTPHCTTLPTLTPYLSTFQLSGQQITQ